MRDFKTLFSPDFLKAYQKGTLSYKYKDLPCLKSPIDMAIYMRLLWLERPATIIEIGTKHGGSALFFSDLSKMMNFNCRIVTIDITPPAGLEVEGVIFLQGDVMKLDEVFDRNRLYDLPRPWFISEDSAHTYQGCMSALSFFSSNLQKGEMLAMEDGILSELDIAERYEGGPNRAIQEFLAENPGHFKVEESYCDMFGFNATYNPNGYLRKL